MQSGEQPDYLYRAQFRAVKERISFRANDRYYANAYGRFMTPDPSRSSGGLAVLDQLGWNRYVFSVGRGQRQHESAERLELRDLLARLGNESGLREQSLLFQRLRQVHDPGPKRREN